MLSVFKDFKGCLNFFSVIARLDRSPQATRRGEAIQRKELDYPVKSYADLREESLRPDNYNHWNRVGHE
jgi:hypothetical protein